MQTGGGPTGKFWAHEHWQLDNPPDIVTFSKKMLSGGFFYKSEFRPDKPFRIFNTWVGDPSKLLLLNEVIKVIEKDQLLGKIAKTGEYLIKCLNDLQTKFPNLLENARGKGTFCAIDFKTTQQRDAAIVSLHKHGIHCGGSGEKTLRIRTTLTFNKHHVNIFIDRFNRVLTQM